MKPVKEIHKYFRIGDIIKNEEIWGNRLFCIYGFGGNAYLPLIYAFPRGEERTVGNQCNFDVRSVKLINADKRPFSKLSTQVLVKLLRKNNEEAKREFIIRSNNKIR